MSKRRESRQAPAVLYEFEMEWALPAVVLVLVLQSAMVLVLVLVLRSSISKEDSRDEICITS